MTWFIGLGVVVVGVVFAVAIILIVDFAESMSR